MAINKSLEKMFGKVYGIDKATKDLAESSPSSVDFSVISPSNTHGSQGAYFTGNEQPAFDADDALKVAKEGLDGDSGAVLFPYINMTFVKEKATLTRMHDEKVLNYTVLING